MGLAYYVQEADKIFPIYGVTSIEEAKKFVPAEDHCRIVETAEDIYMNPCTESVDFESGWEGDTELQHLIQVKYDSTTESWVENKEPYKDLNTSTNTIAQVWY